MNDISLRLPKNNTRTDILELLLGNDMNAIGISNELGINESAIRKHLDILERNKLVKHYFQRSELGRPKKMFCLSDKGKKLFPKKNDLLLTLLCKELLKNLDQEELENIADSLAYNLQEMILEKITVDEGEELFKQVISAFNSFGFYCKVKKETEFYSVIYNNCVFRDVSPEFAKWMCRIHRKVLADILGDIKIEQCSSILEGDRYCSQKITFRKGE